MKKNLLTFLLIAAVIFLWNLLWFLFVIFIIGNYQIDGMSVNAVVSIIMAFLFVFNATLCTLIFIANKKSAEKKKSKLLMLFPHTNDAPKRHRIKIFGLIIVDIYFATMVIFGLIGQYMILAIGGVATFITLAFLVIADFFVKE